MAIAWASGAAPVLAEDLSHAAPCMTTGGDLSLLPELPPSNEETDLWCEDPNDPGCAVGAPRGGETDPPRGATTNAGALSSAAWPKPSISDARFSPAPRLEPRDGVASRVDRPPRRG